MNDAQSNAQAQIAPSEAPEAADARPNSPSSSGQALPAAFWHQNDMLGNDQPAHDHADPHAAHAALPFRIDCSEPGVQTGDPHDFNHGILRHSIVEGVESAPPQLRFPNIVHNYQPDFFAAPVQHQLDQTHSESDFRQRSGSVFATWPMPPPSAVAASPTPGFAHMHQFNQFAPIGIAIPPTSLSPLHAAAAQAAVAVAVTDAVHQTGLDMHQTDAAFQQPQLDSFQQQHYHQPHYQPHAEHPQPAFEQILQSVHMQFSRERSMSLPVIQSQFAAPNAPSFMSPTTNSHADSPYAFHGVAHPPHAQSQMSEGVTLLDSALESMAIASAACATPCSAAEMPQDAFVKLPPMAYHIGLGPRSHPQMSSASAAVFATKGIHGMGGPSMDLLPSRRGSAISTASDINSVGQPESVDGTDDGQYHGSYGMDNPAMAHIHGSRRRSLPAAPVVVASAAAAAAAAMGAPGGTYACTHPGCGRIFTRIQNLRSHARCHLVDAPHVCPTCGLGFRRSTDLHRHVRTMHTPADQKPWACNKCGKRFGRSDALRRHQQSRSKVHACPYMAQSANQDQQTAQDARLLSTTVVQLQQQEAMTGLGHSEFMIPSVTQNQIHTSNATLLTSVPDFGSQL